MSDADLESRILEIIYEGYKEEYGDVIIPDEVAAQILTAIKDAGYIQSSPLKKVQELLRRPGVEKILAESGYTVDFDKLDELANVPVMTGQEWYERLEKELAGKVFYYLKSDDEVSTTLSICLEAAKRAAGLADQ